MKKQLIALDTTYNMYPIPGYTASINILGHVRNDTCTEFLRKSPVAITPDLIVPAVIVRSTTGTSSFVPVVKLLVGTFTNLPLDTKVVYLDLDPFNCTLYNIRYPGYFQKDYLHKLGTPCRAPFESRLQALFPRRA